MSVTLKQHIYDLLKQQNCFWSYAPTVASAVPDDVLIEKALIYLDLKDIDNVISHYGKKHVKRVWRERLVPQEDYYHTLNRFLAWYYFDVKKPDTYLKQQTTKHINRITA